MSYRHVVTVRNGDPFPASVIHAAQKHAMSEFPKESCGLIAGGKYIACKNIHPEPETMYRIDPKKTAEVLQKHGKIDAVVHSHPEGPNYPSFADQQGQITSKLTWGIIPVIGTTENVDGKTETVPVAEAVIWWGDDLPIPPLEGRQFVWGVFHCWSLYRDWVRLEKGVTLPNFACEPDFLDLGHDIFIDNFEAAGLKNLGKIDMAELQVGDMLVGHLKGDFPNHCGVYLGGDDFLHHAPNSLSGKDLVVRWWDHIDTVMRYDP